MRVRLSAIDHARIVAATRFELDSAVAVLADFAETCTVSGAMRWHGTAERLESCRSRVSRANAAWLDSCARRDHDAN